MLQLSNSSSVMETRDHSKKNGDSAIFIKNNRMRVSILTLALFVSVVSLGIFMQSCSKEEEQLDDIILNSSELEDFIIAGAEYNQALADFTKELNKIDFSTLEVTHDAEGRKVMHLPTATVKAIRFDEKDRALNEKKEALRKKFPQFSSFSEDGVKKYFQQCAKSSVNVSSKFLELGINTSLPKLKSGSEIPYDENFCYMMWQMYNWINNPYYTEVYIIGYANGTYEIVQRPGANSVNGGELSYIVVGGHTMYYPNQSTGQQVVSIGHTHLRSPNPTEPYYDENGVYKRADYMAVPSGVTRYIYYNQDIYPY